ncbi:chemotaxis protein CheW [Deltaproteobacteria bacterium TL4]
MSVAEITETLQYFTFKIDDEIFAFKILNVREVLEFRKVTKVPQTPDFMCGVINLRGSVVPVLDLGLKLGMPEIQKTVDTCVIIVELMADEESMAIGVLVDSVSEVIELAPEAIDPPPKLGGRITHEFLIGMGKQHDNFIAILDVNTIFSLEELTFSSMENESQLSLGG